MRNTLIILMGFIISGCASMGDPALTYRDSGHSHSDTAIFAVEGFGDTEAGRLRSISAIWTVDGKSMRHFSMGSELPVWVRVLPGTHQFKISYSKGSAPFGREFAFATKTVADMKPRHVYFAKLIDYGEKYRIDIVDLGENSQFKEHIPGGQSLKPGDYQAAF